MNLHITVDNIFIDRICDNFKELGIQNNNKVIVRSSEKPRHIKHDVMFARMYSGQFNELVGDTRQYENVFIHQFSPLMYRWVAKNTFNSIGWAIWGADLYDLPFVNFNLFEDLTRKNFVNKNKSFQNFLYGLKYQLTNARFREEAYSKVNNVLTWMTSEYEFALSRIPSLQAGHQYFFYENPVAYHELDKYLYSQSSVRSSELPRLIIGNSATPTNNHLDVIKYLHDNSIQADLIIPMSYGDDAYGKFLRSNVGFYKGGKIEFMDSRLSFQDYLNFLNASDGLIMNNIRPQGYGNIFIMMYLNKPVFFNEKNVSLPDLIANGIHCQTISHLKDFSKKVSQDKNALVSLLSHERSLGIFSRLFS